MSGIHHFETFLLSGIMLNITPGSDTIFILTRSIAQGRSAGIASALGIGTGNLVHTLLAAFGLSYVIATLPILFSIIQYAGAGYLIFLGITMLRTKVTSSADLNTEKQQSLAKIYRDGVVTNVLNPKVALFFLAFLPQFITAESADNFVPFILLGFTFTTTGTIWCLVLALFASSLFASLKRHPAWNQNLNRFCGMVMIALGIKLATVSK